MPAHAQPYGCMKKMARDRLLNFGLLFTHLEHMIKPILTANFLSLATSFYSKKLMRMAQENAAKAGLSGQLRFEVGNAAKMKYGSN